MAFDLLPGKHSHVVNYKVDGIYLILTLILPFCIVVGVYMLLLQQQADIQEKIQAYREEQQSLTAIHEADDSVQMAGAHLQATAKLWELLGDAADQSVCLSEVHRNKNKITFNGYTRSALNLKLFAGKLSDSHLLTKMSLSKLIKTKNQHTFEFVLHSDEQVH